MSEEQSKLRYDVEQLLAQGGMGEVLAARDRHFGRAVAMKVIRSECEGSRDIRRRFVQEARILSQLEHPNIVPVYDLDQDDQGRMFYTMKQVQGVTFKEVIDQLKSGEAEAVAKYPLTQLLTIFQKVCDAVAFAHSKGIIHRDLKPENIMLGDYGEVLVMDWGLAKILSAGSSRREEAHAANLETEGQQAENKSEPPHVGCCEGEEGFHEAGDPRPPSGDGGCDLTLDGQIMGTPQFMAPEQAEGRIADIDERSDVFALGAILYSLLTLRPPTGGTTLDEVLDNITSGYIPPPVIYNQARKRAADGSELESAIALAHCPGNRIPDALSAVAMKALAVDPEDRYQTVPELQTEITAYQGGFATSAEQAGAGRRLRLWVRRNKILSAAAAVIVILVGGFMAKVVQERNRAESTLIELRKAIPLMRAEIDQLVLEQKFDLAGSKIDYLISLQPQDPDYWCLKGNMLQSLLHFNEAAIDYQRALTLNPNQAQAHENLALCQKLDHLTQSGRTLAEPQYMELQAVMSRQGRAAEAAAMFRRMGKSREQLFAAWKAALRTAGVDEAHLNTFEMDENGLLLLNLRATPVSDLTFLKGMPFKGLQLHQTKVADLAPLKGMPLESLELTSIPVQDLTPLVGMRLRFLTISGSKVSNVAPLKGMPLEDLYITGTTVSDLTPLAGMPLKSLYMQGCRNITDLSPLHGMPLKILRMESSINIRDLDPLKGCPLEELWFAGRNICDLKPLAGMPLHVLEADGTQVEDLIPLQGLPLETLRILYCSTVHNLAPLKGAKLRELALDSPAVQDISVLGGMPLRRLYLNNTSVSDLQPLRGMPLTNLFLVRTQVKSLRPLEGMPLERLHLANTPITDLTPLRGMPLKELRLDGCRNVQRLAALAECPQLERLSLPYPPPGNIEFLRQLPHLKKLTYTLRPPNHWEDAGYWDEEPSITEFWKAHDARKGKR